MFWKANSTSSSHLETLLNKEDVTLQELMDEEEVLQECKSQNKKLIDFLVQSEILEELVRLTTIEPSGDGDENVRYKYPNIACELLTCEVPQLTERLAGDKVLLGKLYSFLEVDSPLNPLLASFFSKTFGVLIGRKSEQNWYSYQFTCLQVLEFLKSKEDCISLLLKHLGTSAIMDLVFKLITKVEDADMKQSILNWLDDQKVVENIVSLLDPSIDSERHCNAAQLLCDVIRTSRENQKQLTEKAEQDPILDRIESPETVTQLLNHILGENKSETSIVGGISVLLTLLDCDKKDMIESSCNFGTSTQTEELTPDSAEPSIVVLNTVAAILPRLKDFHDILLNPPLKPAVKTTLGVLDPPLGTTRIEITKLFSVLVSTNNDEINKELARLDTINVLLDLFFKYTWNNFLHTQVEQCLAFAFNTELKTGKLDESDNPCLIAHILVKCRLLQRILEAWEDNDIQQTKQNCPRRGYMGHLIKISNNIAQEAEKGPLGAFIKETIDSETLTAWDDFVATKLTDINKTQQICLGGVHPGQSSSEDDDDIKYKDVAFPQDLALDQVYASYQHQQQLAPTFIEQFGSYEEEQFNDSEDLHSTTVDPHMSGMTFNVSENDLDQQAILFGQVCAQKFQTLEDDESDLWDKEIFLNNGSKVNDLQRSEWHEAGGNSSSDEEDREERPGPEGREETHVAVDAIDPWNIEMDTRVAPVIDTNPWSSTSPGFNMIPNSENFESVPFVANFDFNFPPPDIITTIATSLPNDLLEPSVDQNSEVFSNVSNVETNSNLDDVPKDISRQPDVPEPIDNSLLDKLQSQKEWIANAVERLQINDDHVQDETRVDAAGGVQPEDEQISKSADEDGKRADVELLKKILTIPEEIDDNYRYISPQGLIKEVISNSEGSQVEEGNGDSSVNDNLPNVYTSMVPTESTHLVKNSLEECPSPSPVVTSTNGPV